MGGKWINQKSNDTLPIALSFMGSCGEHEEYSGAPCGCDLFNNPIEGLPPVNVDTIKDSNSRAYRRFRMEDDAISMEWFELIGVGEPERTINQKLNADFSNDKDAAKHLYSCRRGTLASFGNAEGEEYRTSKPHLWTDRFLVVAQSRGGFCGGAHPFSEVSYRTFDLSSGDEIDMREWRGWIKGKYLSESGVGEELRKLILYKKEVAEECTTMVNDNDIYSIRPDSAGFVFYTEFGHCCRACEDEYPVTFRELMPFLSEEGKRIGKLLFGLGE